jgi:transposase
MVTIDRFHLAKLIGKAVDNERKIIIKDLKNKYSNDDKTLNVIQNTMWLLRHHFHDLSSDSQKKLDDLFELSPYLEECYELREELYLIFEKDYSKEDAKIQIKNWSERALQCTIMDPIV